MNRTRWRWLAAGLLLLGGRSFAQAPPITADAVNLFAGPGYDYPPVVQLGPGWPLVIYGCVGGYTWCDVSYQYARGWIDGREIEFPYQGEAVPVDLYGPEIGLPLISFDIDTYWGHWYRDRPWYDDRPRYFHHGPPIEEWEGPRREWSESRREHYEHFEHERGFDRGGGQGGRFDRGGGQGGRFDRGGGQGGRFDRGEGGPQAHFHSPSQQWHGGSSGFQQQPWHGGEQQRGQWHGNGAQGFAPQREPQQQWHGGGPQGFAPQREPQQQWHGSGGGPPGQPQHEWHGGGAPQFQTQHAGPAEGQWHGGGQVFAPQHQAPAYHPAPQSYSPHPSPGGGGGGHGPPPGGGGHGPPQGGGGHEHPHG